MTSQRSLRRRFWIEGGLAAISAVLAVITLVSREWIEALSGWDPDHGNGSLEWLIVAGLGLLAIALGSAARLEWHRPLPT